MDEKQKIEWQMEWTEEERKIAEERQKQRFLAYMNSGLSLTKWIEERNNE